ncbi:MAG: hypothetical protein EA396_00110 [Anaerolineaceae bacterium]|nr:MAG: hypothetical protein EA396_00110 [Anaerolineaceae bacterium]
MQPPYPPLPRAEPKRPEIISIRLTVEEREAIGKLADDLDVKAATLARYFVLHGLEHYPKGE